MCYVCWWLVASFSNSWRHASLASYICDSYGCFNNIVFNTKKTTCSVVGNVRHNDVLLFLNNQRVPVVETFKYLGVIFAAQNSLYVDVSFIKRKFYAACNGVLNKCRRSCETVQVHLISSFCLPLLTYSISALEFPQCSVHYVSSEYVGMMLLDQFFI